MKITAVAQSALPLSSLKLGEGQSPIVTLPHPICLLEGLFPTLIGFCLTNGVSFLQHYDPGLVVVMVNLAVVIFYFQTEYSFCHQCTNMLGLLSLL